jgi:hypothetical protein
MLPLSASSDDYAGLIAQLFSDKTSYEQLVRSSRKEYEMRLNWNKWAESMDQLIMNLLDSQSSNR